MVLCTSLAHADNLDDAREAFNEAQLLYKQGKFKSAAKKFRDAYKAKAYPQFLFNIGASYERANNYRAAVDYYGRYLDKVPDAKDKAQIKKRIAVLKEEIERAKKSQDKAPSQKVKQLRAVKLQSVVVIRSTPPGAKIWLDSKKGPPLGLTPWEGNIQGRHVIYVELEGHSPAQDVIEPSGSNRIRDVRFVLTRFEQKAENYLGLLKVTSNVPGAQVFIDNKEAGAYGVTPFQKQIDEGKHKVWVTAPGYNTYEREIDIAKTQVHSIHATLEGSPVGYMNFRGAGIEFSKVWMDDEVICETGPCRVAVPEGKHKFKVSRKDYKSYSKNVTVRSASETRFTVGLVKKPGKADAVVAWTLAAVFAGGATYSWFKLKPQQEDRYNAAKIVSDNVDALFNACPNSDNDCRNALRDQKEDANSHKDEHNLKRKVAKWGAIAGWGAAGISAAVATYYTFRDKGEPSTGQTETRAIKVKPLVGVNFGGLGVDGTF